MVVAAPDRFARLLREHRLAAALTQEALAERAGLSVDGVQKVERGVTRPYRDTVQRLARALGLRGEEERAFREAAPAPPRRRPPVQLLAADRPRHNLPRPLTSFVGREREVAAVRDLLDRTPLVTLTGPGGVGKTRLAVELAAALIGGYADGVWLVDLASLDDPDLAAQAVAAAVGVREQPQQPVLATLAAALQRRQLLLVLDNCEHLLGACAAVATTLLQACDRLRVLATSREPLGVAGEAVWRLGPLGGNADDQAESAATCDAAVRLFADRAAAADPAFALTEAAAPAVAQLCRRLDGLPLAIELAAPLVRVLSLDELDRRLDDRLRLLAGRDPMAPARQQTLRAAVGWSYDLLDQPARLLFQRLAVFAGGWTLEAAEEVCAGDGLERAAILPLLIRLVDQSLVVAEGRAAGPRRYHLLETLREYAREHLAASGEDEVVRARHAAHYLAQAESGGAAATAVGLAITQADLAAKLAWLDLMEAEHANLRAAWRWLVDRRESERGLRLAGTLQNAAYRRGHLAEGHALLSALLDADEAGEPSPALVHAFWTAAHLAQYFGGDFGAAQTLAERCLDAQRRLGDRPGVAAALSLLALTRREQGDHTAARALLEESLAINQELGNQVGIAVAVNRLGEAAHALGDYDGARALYEQAWQLLRTIGNPKLTPWPPLDLGCLALDRGDYPAARALLQEGLVSFWQNGDTHGVVYGLVAFASLVAAEGRLERALRLGGAATALAEAFGACLVPTYRARFDRSLASARQALSAEVAAAAWAKGRALTLDRAIAAALAGPSAAAPAHARRPCSVIPDQG